MRAVADLRRHEGRTPLRGSKFHAVFGKMWQNHILAPPWGVGAPPRGNPGSATGEIDVLLKKSKMNKL